MIRLSNAMLVAAALVTLPMVTARGKPTAPFPEAIVVAWTKAGAREGWMPEDRYGAASFRFAREGPHKKNDLPAFRFLQWRGGVSDLPQPERPFGLYLHSSGINNEGLKEFAGLTRLPWR